MPLELRSPIKANGIGKQLRIHFAAMVVPRRKNCKEGESLNPLQLMMSLQTFRHETTVASHWRTD
jgi:hypothetical protein